GARAGGRRRRGRAGRAPPRAAPTAPRSPRRPRAAPAARRPRSRPELAGLEQALHLGDAPALVEEQPLDLAREAVDLRRQRARVLALGADRALDAFADHGACGLAVAAARGGVELHLRGEGRGDLVAAHDALLEPPLEHHPALPLALVAAADRGALAGADHAEAPDPRPVALEAARQLRAVGRDLLGAVLGAP